MRFATRSGNYPIEPCHAEQKEKRNAEQRTAAEANELPLCEVEQHLAFYTGQVLGDVDIGHKTPRISVDIIYDTAYNTYEVIVCVTI